MEKYAPITNQDFVRILAELLDDEDGDSLLQIPGIYEVVSEHFNNQVLDQYDEENEHFEDYKTVLDEFEVIYKPAVEKQYGTDDAIAMREEFNNFTDALCKEGRISEYAYENWDNPY